VIVGGRSADRLVRRYLCSDRRRALVLSVDFAVSRIRRSGRKGWSSGAESSLRWYLGFQFRVTHE
jgi:hypothetical protein